jgi:dGTPase
LRLKEICNSESIGTFCHNAQSVRFLTELEKNGEGLNLSLQVLDGILCHNGELLSSEYRPNYGKTWEQFEEEYKQCLLIDGYDRHIVPTTLEGCVVRVADVIAYVGRDIEDAIMIIKGLIIGFTWSQCPAGRTILPVSS